MTKRTKPTLIDIAAACDTSIATVSRALSKPGLVQPETLERVRRVAASMGYVPNRRARALVSGRSNTVGVAVPTLASPVFSATLQEMQKTLSANGYQLLIASHEYDPAARGGRLVATYLARGGCACGGGGRAPANHMGFDRQRRIALGCSFGEGREGFDRVLVDNHHAGELAAQHLLDLGHCRLGVILWRHGDQRPASGAGGGHFVLHWHARGWICRMRWFSEQPPNVMAGRSGCAAILEQGRAPPLPSSAPWTCWPWARCWKRRRAALRCRGPCLSSGSTISTSAHICPRP